VRPARSFVGPIVWMAFESVKADENGSTAVSMRAALRVAGITNV
jgi:hypothetical protein